MYRFVSSLVSLCHHRWSLPVLAEIGRTGGSRFAGLTGRLGVTGESLRRTLAYLQVEGLVDRNPGYGHPLRPEYLLTDGGREIAPRARKLHAALAGREDVGLKKWSLPVLAELDEPRRFSELRAALPATPRALTLALKDLESAGLVHRTVTTDRPPRVRYAATRTARPIVAAAGALRSRRDAPSG
jgi:DNA-binding HxlR family transcriptional regulator